MRYIDLGLLAPRPEFQALVQAAEGARAEILAEPDPMRRHELIEAHRAKWVAFRPLFEQLSHGKCWYTESINPGTDDDVDHFRPKNGLAEDDTHTGYWWEALNWRNFRLSCHRANRLRMNPETGQTHGKGDHFPLLHEGDRCRLPGHDLGRERPLLLDPTDPFDPPLLSFNIDGTTGVAPDFQTEGVSTRLEASRIYLHLDWPALKEQRQQLYSSVFNKVSDGESQEQRARQGDVGSRDALKATARELIELARPEMPYSMAAKAFILTFRHIPWVRQAVLHNCA